MLDFVLLIEGAIAFCLEGKCEIITSSEDILSDDEVFFLLNSQSEVLYIRKIEQGKTSSVECVEERTSQPAAAPVAKENEAIQLIVQEHTLQLNQQIIGTINQEGDAELIPLVFYILSYSM